jgi:hypothetical protein
MTPIRMRLRMGYRRPDSCRFGAQVQLQGSGRLTVVLRLHAWLRPRRTTGR